MKKTLEAIMRELQDAVEADELVVVFARGSYLGTLSTNQSMEDNLAFIEEAVSTMTGEKPAISAQLSAETSVDEAIATADAAVAAKQRSN